MKFAILSDTHGLLRPEVIDRIRGCDEIIHAGDLGKVEVLSELQKVATTHVIRGNVDHGSEFDRIPDTLIVSIGNMSAYLVHDIADLLIDPADSGIDLLIFGHSHKPDRYEKDGVTYLNPGSIGPRRFDLPISFAFLTLDGGSYEIEFVELGS